MTGLGKKTPLERVAVSGAASVARRIGEVGSGREGRGETGGDIAADAGAEAASDHLCVIYENGADLLQNCAALTRRRALGGMRWLGIFDAHVARDALAPLSAEAPDLGAIASAEELFAFQAAPICVATVVAKLRALCDAALADGYRGLLVLIDMSWMLDAPSGLANLGELEAGLHQLAQEAPLRIVCMYSREFFPANVLLDAMRTHPAVLEAGEVRANPHFLPPSVFLSGDARKKLDWWLKGVRESAPEHGVSARVPVPPLACALLPDPLASGSAPPMVAAKGEGERMVRCRPPASMGPVRSNFEIAQFGEPPEAGQTLKRWKIRCLGELRIYPNDGGAVAWNRCSGATYKTKTLFAFLLQKGAKGASVEETADLLWPESSDLNQSLNRLYHTVHCLRMALSPELSSSRKSPYLVSRNRRYYLTLPEGTWVDVPVFEQFCRQGEVLLKSGEIEQALTCHLAAERLYSGPLFADIPLEYVEDPERDWCWSQRFWLEEIYLKMLACTASIYRQKNDPRLALDYCERVLRVDPCAESAHREAMRAYHMIGRMDALERQYRLCRESLKRFEDRDPARETAMLARELMG
jgi:two-component SAPR family response regulator